MEVRTLQDLRIIVKAQRRALKLNQETVAERAGVSRRWISMFENGHETAEVGKLLAVLGALDIRIDASSTNSPPAHPGDGLDPRDRDAVTDLREALRNYDEGDF